jgi:D-tagatose-1,6-bisphosphate aldolase subunit GatZ/KbaZ
MQVPEGQDVPDQGNTRAGSKVGPATNLNPLAPCFHFQNVLGRNAQVGRGGVYAVCSAHPRVIDAAIRQAIEDDSILDVESTSSQVNQFGGYTGLAPDQFARFVRSAGERAGLPTHRILLGGDHLGPFPWRTEAADVAMEKARELVRSCVRARYQKIHLDASMPCADDHVASGNVGVDEQTIATRAAILCEAAEIAAHHLHDVAPQLVYVIGTEVPAPGGEDVDAQGPTVTAADDVHRTLEIFHAAFQERGLASAWERVVALVVQPGVDFGAESIFEYDAGRARALSTALSTHAGIIYEAHSTDYQAPSALAQMVNDHFAILKVGPWLTFAFREAVLALSSIERELFTTKSQNQLSRVREVLEEAMMQNPAHWRAYYKGDQEQVRRNLIFGYSDRCRYYWHEASVQNELTRLMNNLASCPIPLPLISQYLPEEYTAIRSGRIQPIAEQVIDEHIRQVLRVYATACANG